MSIEILEWSSRYQLGYQANWELVTLWAHNVHKDGKACKGTHETSYIFELQGGLKKIYHHSYIHDFRQLQIKCGLITQLVEYCTSTVEVTIITRTLLLEKVVSTIQVLYIWVSSWE